MSEAAVYERRKRICDLGYLRRAFRRSDGSLGYRCPAEPAADYERKGGNPADLAGRKCVCNGLLSTMGLGQILGGGQHEVALMTAGDDVARLGRFVRAGHRSYTAGEVVDYLLGRKQAELVTNPVLDRAAGCACEPALG